MPAINTFEAAERLADIVSRSRPAALREIQEELFPEETPAQALSAVDLAEHVRGGLEADELVDLWNVVFPSHRNVRFDEEDSMIHYNEGTSDDTLI